MHQTQKLDQVTKKQLQALVQNNSGWDGVPAFRNFLVECWSKEPLVGETEFQTLVNAIKLDAKKEALDQFITNIEIIAHDN